MRWPSKQRMKRRPRGTAAEQVALVDALSWQVQRWIVEANLQASKATPTVLTSCEKGLRRAQYKTVLQSFSNKLHTSWHFGVRGKGGNLQAGHGLNVVSALAEGRPVCRRHPDHAECWEFLWAGSEACSNRTSFAFSGPISRNHVVLELCGMDVCAD